MTEPGFMEVLCGGNQLAHVLVTRLGASFATMYPQGLKADTMLQVLGAGETYNIWCCWAAIMRLRDRRIEEEKGAAWQSKIAEAVQPPRCGQCKFYLLPSSEWKGQCRRKPEFLPKSPDSWCGEYKPK